MSIELPYNNNLHDYGYYEVDNRKFLVKHDALLYATQHNKTVKWNFNDEYFSSFDWSVEPTETLEYLYAERARQLRQRYDYLVLHYSGGYDSNNIIETFIKNNIHLDEVVIRAPNINDYDPSSGLTADNHYAEAKHVAYPLALAIKNLYMPHLKITVLDTAPLIVNWFTKNKNWFDNVTWVTDPSAVMRSNFDMLDDNLIHMAEKGIKIGHVTGHDKPNVNDEPNGSYAVSFTDIISTRGYLTPRLTHRDLPYYFEFFYWHKDSVKMMIKQAHTVVRAKANGKCLKPLIYPITNDQEKERNGYEWRVYEDEIAESIYSRMFPRSWTSFKTAIKMIGDDHSWIFKHSDSEFFKNWKRNMLKLHFSIDKRFHRDDDFFEWGSKILESKKYLIK